MFLDVPLGAWAYAGSMIGVMLIALAIVRMVLSAVPDWHAEFAKLHTRLARMEKAWGIEDDGTGDRKVG